MEAMNTSCAFNGYVFTPHRMGGIVRGTIDTSITMLGEKLPHPVFVTPMGSHALVHPEGEVATARGAATSGALLVISIASTRSMEDIANASSGPKWFQIYLNTDMGLSREQLQRARAAGFREKRSRDGCKAFAPWSGRLHSPLAPRKL